KNRKESEKNIFVINLSEGFRGNNREAHFSSILELLDIPYSCGSHLHKALVLDKIKTKELFIANDIPTARYTVIRTYDDVSYVDMEFPLFLKPAHEGSGLGISSYSKVNNFKELKLVSSNLLKEFNQPVLVEEFLDGEEFAIGLLGDEILPIVSVSYHDGFGSEDAKNNGGFDFFIDKNMSSKRIKELKDLARKAFNVTLCQDLARVDIRCNAKGDPFVLEINSPPEIIPDDSTYGLALASAGYSQEDLFKLIIENALKRY
ncbi:MAG: D-alanine--D-alanine ligase family protein, partial [bacterium]